MKKPHLRLLSIGFIIVILLSSLLIAGCSSGEAEKTDSEAGAKDTGARFEQLSDFEGCTIGSQTGTIFDSYVDRAIDDAKFKYYDDISGELLALKNGDIDAIGLDEPVARLAENENKDTGIFDTVIQTDSYGLIFPKGSPLTDSFSEVIGEYYDDGTIDRLKEKWFSADERRMEINYSEYTGYDAPNGELRLYHDSTQIPMSYVNADGRSEGYEIELILMIAKKLGMTVRFTPVNFASLITSVGTGKADVACGCITITDERRESVDFSDTHYVGGIVFLCRSADLGHEEALGDTTLKESFSKTFIRDDRYKMILSGLGITVLISLLALVFGTIIGFGICLLRRSKSAAVSKACAAVIRIIQGIPVLVLLLVLYYVVFASASLSGLVVSIIAFSLNFGVNSAEIMRTGIDGIDIGQWEAASMLGLSRPQIFRLVIMPQAIQRFHPAFKGEFINMLKMTSVVGYIAVVDLTKASDIIRSHTYEALFPLITVAIIYFLLAWGLTALIGIAELKVSHRKKVYNLKKINEDSLYSGAVCPLVEASAEEIIRVEHLHKIYEEAAPVVDMNAVINKGEVVSIIGPSGTGKTTLLRLIGRLENQTSGKIFVNGKDMDNKADSESECRKIGMLFQSFNLFPHLTVIENIALAPICVNKKSKAEAYNHAYDLLKIVGLQAKANVFPKELSGGQAQRVAIARTLAMEPDIILLDEPTSALDPSMISEVLNVIRRLSKRGLTMLIVTHELRFAKAVSTRVFYLDEGVVFEEGTPEQIFDHPFKESTRRFVHRLKVFEESITSTEFDFIGINTGFEEFGRKNLLSQRSIHNLQVAFEEVAVEIIMPRLGVEPKMTVVVEHSEDSGNVRMVLRYNGASFDPSDKGDEMQNKIINNAAAEIRHAYLAEGDLRNEAMIIIKG